MKPLRKGARCDAPSRRRGALTRGFQALGGQGNAGPSPVENARGGVENSLQTGLYPLGNLTVMMKKPIFGAPFCGVDGLAVPTHWAAAGAVAPRRSRSGSQRCASDIAQVGSVG